MIIYFLPVSIFTVYEYFLFQKMFAFDFKETYDNDGWSVYDSAAEYKRLVSYNFRVESVSFRFAFILTN